MTCGMVSGGVRHVVDGEDQDFREVASFLFVGVVVEPQGKEAALLVQRVAKAEHAGLQLRPVRAERLRRHAEHQHARVLQSFLDLRRNAVAGLENPFIEPHFHPVLPQPLRQRTHHRLVLRAVAQEDVELEFVRHACAQNGGMVLEKEGAKSIAFALHTPAGAVGAAAFYVWNCRTRCYSLHPNMRFPHHESLKNRPAQDRNENRARTYFCHVLLNSNAFLYVD